MEEVSNNCLSTVQTSLISIAPCKDLVVVLLLYLFLRCEKEAFLSDRKIVYLQVVEKNPVMAATTAAPLHIFFFQIPRLVTSGIHHGSECYSHLQAYNNVVRGMTSCN
ncbi:hypothetical protein T440DRAFT_470546 [Plenodomus tracheiphilus IPT5]|uniref:Uncharacterized protein n=1 Tax=Plenodomus tracheiphilus IPT5 TaxID=1408161 RepID=A0A6A7B0N2_9PLEO|nr:hypothetical protein T440DRAFT_470546 [Plenodomus tracheiphilus IPT5]